MEERFRFVEDFHSEDWDMAELCRFYGVSRATGYKWVERYQTGGLEALKDRFARVLAGFIIAAKENGIIPFERLKLAPLFFWKLWISDSKNKQVEMAQVDLTEKEAFLSSQNIEAVATFLVHL